MDEIVINSPVDMHVHLRQGSRLKQVAPLSAATWSAVLAMPNTEPVIDTSERAAAYRYEALAAAGDPSARYFAVNFDVYSTLYFRPDYTREFLRDAKPHILSVKFYPKNLTTNSRHGCSPHHPGVPAVLAAMEELGIPLNVHAEAEGYYHDREQLFAAHIYRWALDFPNLKIVLEHLSDAASLPLLSYPNVYATLTPQHLLTTGNDWFGPPFNPHLYCMPCVKRPEDRAALMEAATTTYPWKVMAGTDSAPHGKSDKHNCGCAGVFSAPIALQLYTKAFADFGRLDRLQGFLSENARRIYGIKPPPKRVRLVRAPYVIPDSYGDVVPMWAGKTIDWSIADL